MHLLRKNKFSILLLCVAALSFAFLSLGGNYFHELAHHHEQGHDQECPLYQLLMQTFVALLIAIAAVKLAGQNYFFGFCRSVISRLQYSLPHLRAPPIA